MNCQIELKSECPTSLPTNQPIAIAAVLYGYVEIAQPATTRDLRILSQATEDAAARADLDRLSQSYATEVNKKHVSVLDLLEKHPSIKLSLPDYLALLPSMRVRQYSISSSPLWNPQHVTLTISVVEAKALSGSEEPFLGVASTYLARLRPGDRVHMAVRPSNTAFSLPADPTTPIVMFCAGSGFAPMRGFIQEPRC
jgi:cytochrome P450/NADPH-cytochrome P450 reductase